MAKIYQKQISSDTYLCAQKYRFQIAFSLGAMFPRISLSQKGSTFFSKIFFPGLVQIPPK